MRIHRTILSCGVLLAAALAAQAQDAPQIAPPSLIFELLALNGDIETAAKPKYFSPGAMVVSPDRKTLYVAGQSGKQVAVVDLATNAILRLIALPNEPTGLAISSDGATLYVTCSSERWPNGMVCVVNTAAGKVTSRVSVGHSARSPQISPDGKTLYVCNWLANTVSVVDLTAGKEVAQIPVHREPYASAITPDGKFLLVTNSLPEEKATDTSNAGGKIGFVNTQTRTLTATLRLPAGSHSLFGVTITPDGKYAFVTHLIARTTLPALTPVGGWIHSNNCAVIDVAAQKLANDIELDYNSQGSANPWQIACSDDGKQLCIAHAGTNELSVINLAKLLTTVIGAKDLSHDFTTISPMRQALRMRAASGARAVAIAGKKAYVAGFFSDSMDVVSLDDAGNSRVSASFALTPAKRLTRERIGERAFYDGTLCMQSWQSCHSCHPFTRPDALNWILNGSNNSPKNVKTMLWTFQTPPTSWAGKRRNAYESVRSGVSAELFTAPNEQVALGIDTMFWRLKPVASPLLVKGQLSPSAQRGKTVYYGTKVDCAACHPAPLFTDMKFHNSGVPDAWDANKDWDTPPLVEVWRTGPYGHLGSYTAIEEILKLPGHSFNVSSLSEQEFKDLVEYVLSL